MLALAPRITCPVLYIRGDKEPAHIYPAEEFAARAGGRCDVRIVKDCDHFYGGREDTISAIVTDWLQDLGLKDLLAQNLISRARARHGILSTERRPERPRTKYREDVMALHRRTVLKGLGATAALAARARRGSRARRPARCASDFSP